MSRPVRLGLRENAGQFALLVGLNALVGAMVGLERSVLPLVGEEDFGLASRAAVLAFVVAFGAAKALTNLAAGGLAARAGRRRLLIAGWAVALPVPAMIASPRAGAGSSPPTCCSASTRASAGRGPYRRQRRLGRGDRLDCPLTRREAAQPGRA
jgi:MFS family permease